jgi:hypothetical protein
MDESSGLYTAFDGHRRLASGSLAEVALAVKRALEARSAGPVFAYDDTTGQLVDIDTRGSESDVLARLEPSPEARGPGRPKLGVVAREVTLLPRHWEWLNEQPGGASVALRKLVEHARRFGGERERIRRGHEAAYAFMSSLAGDFPGFEEASRALFANDVARFRTLVAEWPPDVRDHVQVLAFRELGRNGEVPQLSM